jgi:hypothetical protein
MTPAAAERSSKPPTKSKAAAPEQVTWPPPLKPRRRLFIVLLCVFAAWVGVLLWMYVTTMPPTPSSPGTTTPALAKG